VVSPSSLKIFSSSSLHLKEALLSLWRHGQAFESTIPNLIPNSAGMHKHAPLSPASVFW
jgi:hypothetical protein